MKRIIVLIVAALLLVAGCAPQQTTPTPTPTAEVTPAPEPAETPEAPVSVPAAEQKDGVFVVEDVQTVSAGLLTLGDYMNAVGAMEASWRTEADGAVVNIEGDRVRVSVSVMPEGGLLEGREEGENAAPAQGSRALLARLESVYWEWPDTGIETVRGIQPGAWEEDVRAAFYDSGDETEIYTAEDVLPGVKLPEGEFLGAKRVVEEGEAYLFYNWRDPAPAPGGVEQAALYYYLADGVVMGIALYVFWGD